MVSFSIYISYYSFSALSSFDYGKAKLTFLDLREWVKLLINPKKSIAFIPLLYIWNATTSFVEIAQATEVF